MARNSTRVSQRKVDKKLIQEGLHESEQRQVAMQLYRDGETECWEDYPHLFESHQEYWSITEEVWPGSSLLADFAHEGGYQSGADFTSTLLLGLAELHADEFVY